MIFGIATQMSPLWDVFFHRRRKTKWFDFHDLMTTVFPQGKASFSRDFLWICKTTFPMEDYKQGWRPSSKTKVRRHELDAVQKLPKTKGTFRQRRLCTEKFNANSFSHGATIFFLSGKPFPKIRSQLPIVFPSKRNSAKFELTQTCP